MALTKELGVEQVDKAPELDDLNAVIERAVEVIGDREKTYRWLGTPVRAIAYATPISLLATAEGRHQVLAVLSRLEHGDL